MKTYAIDVRYYIQAESEEELKEKLRKIGISNNKYYGGYYSIEYIEEDIYD